MSKRYIDADVLKSRMFNYYECVNENTGKSNYNGETLMNYEVADMIEDCIENAPTADVVEVVRCKDCIYSFMSISGEKVLYCDMHPSDDHLGLDKDHFCSYGERKEQCEKD